jgi:hypothetical protein
MNCPSCNDRGIFRVAYHDGSPADFAICLCKAGERMRIATNNGKPVTPQWQVWAFTQGIPLEHVCPMEDVLTADEMAARGFTELTAGDALSAIAAAAKARSQR